MNHKVQIYNEDGDCIYIGHYNDKETHAIIKNKKYDLEYGSDIVFIYLEREK